MVPWRRIFNAGHAGSRLRGLWLGARPSGVVEATSRTAFAFDPHTVGGRCALWPDSGPLGKGLNAGCPGPICAHRRPLLIGLYRTSGSSFGSKSWGGTSRVHALFWEGLTPGCTTLCALVIKQCIGPLGHRRDALAPWGETGATSPNPHHI